jgi:hypothetical protein
LIGVKLGSQFAMASMATVGSDGKPHIECGRLSEVVERLKHTKPVTHSAEKETANDR